MRQPESKPPTWFWITSVALLLWGLGGASIYVAYFIETPGGFAQTAETAANRTAYAEYIASIPSWAIAVGVGAALTRLLGAIGLLLRRAWSMPLYVVSLLLFLVAVFRAFVLARVSEAMSPQHITVEVLFVVFGLLAIWFARMGRSRGFLS